MTADVMMALVGSAVRPHAVRPLLMLANDELNLAAVGSLFPTRGGQKQRDRWMKTRLLDLALNRCRIAPSTIEGAGNGLFAARGIDQGELVTLYPGDVLATWPEEVLDGSETPSEEGVFFELCTSHDGSEWRANWERQDPVFIAKSWGYGVRTGAKRAIMGDPANNKDTAYLGHIANDGAMCPRPGSAVELYTEASERAANVALDTLSMHGCHHAMVATRAIRSGEEVFMSYGASYWISRMAEKPMTYTFPDGSSYFGEVAAGEIHGHGEYKDALGNRYVGEFAHGKFDGVGTYFRHQDGHAVAGSYANGVGVGDRVGWGADRTEAYRLVQLGEQDGAAAEDAAQMTTQRQPVSTEVAASLAQSLGVAVPPHDVTSRW